MEQNFDNIVEHLLEAPYWVIDLLPSQVPQDAGGRFFAVEQFYLQEPQHERLRSQFANVLLKLNCYHDLLVNHDNEWVKNPDPETLVEWLTDSLCNGHLCILVNDGESLITASGGDICLTIYNPSADMLQLVQSLAYAEGLFLWKP